MPLADKNVGIADGPEIGTIGMSCSIHVCKKRAPGSEINGVPASETMARDFPERRWFNKKFSCSFSLNLCKLIICFLRDRCRNNVSVTRVSSAAISGASVRI